MFSPILIIEIFFFVLFWWTCILLEIVARVNLYVRTPWKRWTQGRDPLCSCQSLYWLLYLLTVLKGDSCCWNLPKPSFWLISVFHVKKGTYFIQLAQNIYCDVSSWISHIWGRCIISLQRPAVYFGHPYLSTYNKYFLSILWSYLHKS